MRIIRQDIVGTIDMRLVKRPTNTCAGVDNFHLYANGPAEAFPAPVVRFMGNDPLEAQARYDDYLEAATDVFRSIPITSGVR